MFLYDQLVVLKAPNYLQKIEYILDYMMIGIATLFLIIGYPKLYTCTVSILVILTTSLAIFLKAPNKGIFYISYVIILMPFTLVNGVLTGYFTDNPIVWYNNAENLGIRFLTIPIEDFLYYFLMYEICYLSYEQIKKAIFKMA
jgi:lycopene cyclase domain-containing protein